MRSKESVRANLVNYTTADCSEVEVKNNRYHYWLKFEDNSIGWDWLYGQVNKCASEIDMKLELWKIHPSGMQSFEVEVREVERREGIDSKQHDFSDFE